jgi:hypothetical protein
MTETRITLTLDQVEARALAAMAQADCRQPRDQVKRLTRSEAEKRGLWPIVQEQPVPQREAVRP